MAIERATDEKGECFECTLDGSYWWSENEAEMHEKELEAETFRRLIRNKVYAACAKAVAEAVAETGAILTDPFQEGRTQEAIIAGFGECYAEFAMGADEDWGSNYLPAK